MKKFFIEIRLHLKTLLHLHCPCPDSPEIANIVLCRPHYLYVFLIIPHTLDNSLHLSLHTRMTDKSGQCIKLLGHKTIMLLCISAKTLKLTNLNILKLLTTFNSILLMLKIFLSSYIIWYTIQNDMLQSSHLFSKFVFVSLIYHFNIQYIPK